MGGLLTRATLRVPIDIWVFPDTLSICLDPRFFFFLADAKIPDVLHPSSSYFTSA